ncbi:MAG: hypothetical protein KF882_09575 [Bacteroidia bacterium]|nr:hypothetical protein [Bacteroidia bacterium]MCO5254741.1 hypothetical protein [Bacteroidota bacterium]
MKKLILLISIAILATISSCKKDKKCPDISTILIEQEMKDWIVFQPGSYWIYIDSITGSYDSVYVTSTYYDTLNILHSDLFRNSDSKCIIQSHQEIDIEYETSSGIKYAVGGSYGFGSGVSNNVNPVNGSSSIVNLNHSGGDGGYSHYMYFPVLQGTVGFVFGEIKHDTIYENYTVLGNTYIDVLRVSDRDNGALNAITKFYHAKHIGVIRKEIYEWKSRHDKSTPKLLHVWELADYKVIQ